VRQPSLSNVAFPLIHDHHRTGNSGLFRYADVSWIHYHSLLDAVILRQHGAHEPDLPLDKDFDQRLMKEEAS
jgi:hypothetical protein